MDWCSTHSVLEIHRGKLGEFFFFLFFLRVPNDEGSLLSFDILNNRLFTTLMLFCSMQQIHRVLDEGPDVMFSVADLDTTDDTIEIIASQFFNRKLTLHSIRRGPEPKVVFRRTLDDRCGASFSSILADLNGVCDAEPTARAVIDSGSTVPTLKPGDQFSHLLVTSHECTFAEEDDNKRATQRHTLTLDPRKNEDSFKSEVRMGSSDGQELHSTASTSASATVKSTIDGGSLFSYKVPTGKNAWKTEPWTRSIIATGFRVKGQLGNMINPGAPGFW